MNTLTASREQRTEVEAFLDNMKASILEQLDLGALVELGIQNICDDVKDGYGFVTDKIFRGMQWSIKIDPMRSKLRSADSADR